MFGFWNTIKRTAQKNYKERKSFLIKLQKEGVILEKQSESFYHVFIDDSCDYRDFMRETSHYILCKNHEGAFISPEEVISYRIVQQKHLKKHSFFMSHMDYCDSSVVNKLYWFSYDFINDQLINGGNLRTQNKLNSYAENLVLKLYNIVYEYFDAFLSFMEANNELAKYLYWYSPNHILELLLNNKDINIMLK